MAGDWEELLPVLARRVADDTGRDLDEVTARLDAAYRGRPEDVDIDELVELLAPTVAAIMGPALMPVLERLEQLPPDERLPVLAPIVLGILPAVVHGAAIGLGARGA